MRICVMANALSVHTQRWARAYAEHGHDVHVMSIRRAEIPGVTVHTCRVGPTNSTSVLWSLLSYVRLALAARRRLNRINPHVVNAHYTVTHGAILAFTGFHPSVVSCWGKDVIWDGTGRMPWLLRMLNRYALSRADVICSTSEFMIEPVTGMAPAGKPVRRVPFGVDCERFSPGDAADAKPDRGFRIGFVKTMAKKYGPDVLIRAMPAIVERVPDARLVMAGRGPMEPELKRLVVELGLERHVEFPGFVPNDEVPALMRSFDLFVNCSVYHSESFGVVVLEASACGVPVVVTRVGGVPEVCRHGETGLMVEAGDGAALATAIIRLAKDEELRSRMARAGRRFVLEHYQWKDNVELMLRRLREVSGNFRHPGGTSRT